MHIALRTALDRLMYEEAVVIHILNLAPPDAWERRVGESGRSVGDEVARLAAALDSLAGWIEAGFQPVSGPKNGQVPHLDGRDAGVELLRAGLRRVFAAAASTPADAVPGDALAALWEAASVFTGAREDLLKALPEAGSDPVVQRWQRAPAPPKDAPIDARGGSG
jgi:hypothetical protein